MRQAALRRLKRLLADDPQAIELLVTDTDELSHKLREDLEELHGWGEMFWIRNGVIVAAIRRPGDLPDLADEVHKNNDLLLRQET